MWNANAKAGFSRCLVSAVMTPGQYAGGSGLFVHEFKAPEEFGLHWITHSEIADFKCEDIPSRHEGRPESAIAAILVAEEEQ